MTNQGKKVLFVMSGGGMPGIDIHAGIWLALEEAGIIPDEISATSAGAVIGASMAAGWSAGAFEEFLRVHDDEHLRHERPFWKARFPWLNSIHENDRILSCLEGMFPVYWSGMRTPFSAWACRIQTGEKMNVARPELSRYPAEAVLASLSIAGFFPPVTLLDGEDYVDGGVRFNLPLPANHPDFDEVYLLIATPRPSDYQGRTILTNLVRNLNILMLDQVADILEETHGDPRVRVIWPQISGAGSMLRLNHDLIDQAYRYTANRIEQLKGGIK